MTDVVSISSCAVERLFSVLDKTIQHHQEPTMQSDSTPPAPAASESRANNCSSSRNVFKPHWPDGLEERKFYEIPCDDDGRSHKATLKVMFAADGDAHVSISKFMDPVDPTKGIGNQLSGMPSVRIRTLAGGGKNARTRQALLWLAEAIRLDNADNPENAI